MIYKKNNKVVIFYLLFFVVLCIFFFPKSSTEWINESETRKVCRCFGLKYEYTSDSWASSFFESSSTMIYCFGIPYACEVEQASEVDNMEGNEEEDLVSYSNGVSVFYPDGSRKDVTIKQEIGVDVAGYCQPVKDLIIKALDDMSLAYELQSDTESEYFFSIDSIKNSENRSWKVYLNDILSPYDINNHCYEDTWSVKLRYE